MKPGFIYILTNYSNTTLYIGVTSNLPQRIIEHKEKKYQNSFSARYNLNKLVYYEQFQMIGDAISREKQLKGGSRAKKVVLINSLNPKWEDLFWECSINCVISFYSITKIRI
jgi:putative endonuclease